MKKIRCDFCGKTFLPGTREDGLPNGVGFIDKEGNPLNMCAECIIRIGEELENGEQTIS